MTTTSINTNHLGNHNEPLPLPFRAVGFATRTVGNLFPRSFGWLMMHLFRTPIGRSKPKASDLESAEIHSLPFDGGEVAVYSWGNGPSVLLVHGWRAHAGRYRKLIPALLAAGFQIIALDLPAHGNSAGRRTDPFLSARAIKQVTTTFGPLHAIIAHSFGAASTAVHMSQGGTANRVVLMGCPNEMSEIMASFAHILGMSQRVFRGMLGQMEKSTGNPVTTARTAAWMRTNTTPGLIIHDTEDEIVGYDSAQKIAAAWKSAEIHTTHGLGHSKIMRDPAVIERIVSFLRIEE